jgi:hypothetical protein
MDKPINNPQVAVYYFPNYHVDARNEWVHGKGWMEWELVKHAKPRFKGHQQPKLPANGFQDESDPEVMASKIDLAADHGIDAFIFDWYWYDDGPFLQNGLERGFFNAANSDRLKFAIMWANHDWVDIHPCKRMQDPLENANLLYPGAVTAETFERVMDHCIENYFSRDNYWLINGCPYFSFYAVERLVTGLGGMENTRAMLERFRQKVKAAGFPDIHLNAVIYTSPILSGEAMPVDVEHVVEPLGFDSITSYVWIHHYTSETFPEVEYATIKRAYFKYWDEIAARSALDYYPNVTMGWDSSPRTVQSDRFDPCGYPYMFMLKNNTPEAFAEALEETRQRLLKKPVANPFLTINAWNEWTEGSYLEPDLIHGTAYLEAIRKVFGGNPPVDSLASCADASKLTGGVLAGHSDF